MKTRTICLCLVGILCSGLLAAPSNAQDADSDGDGVTNVLELNGYRFNVNSGAFDSCTPVEDEGCYVTDPLSWSSDGDPYSDYQEASGVNMDNTVGVPYNSPLVAAYPIIEVSIADYSFTSNATITDSNGREISKSDTFESSVETTKSASVTAKVETDFTGVGASVEATASYSKTEAYSSSTTSGQVLNWETASSSDLNDAGTLFLSLYVENTGGATALNVRPSFNVYIGDDLVATVLPDEPFRESLAPGETSVPDVPLVGGEPLGITLSFARLKALQTGSPVVIEVDEVLADIQRWRPEDSNWECGSGETCSWTSFQNQIFPRTLRLLVDFGYSGDPNASIPFDFRGNPYEYLVYTGSPNSNPEFTLRDVIRIVQHELTESGSGVSIEGRPYPSAWMLTAQVNDDGYSPILEAWEAAGEPDDLMDLEMPTQATLLMASPDPVDPGPVITAAAFTKDMLGIQVAAAPKGSIPVVEGEAHVFQNGGEHVYPLVRPEGSAYWTTKGGPDSLFYLPAGAQSSYVVMTDASGATRQTDMPIGLPVGVFGTCSEVPFQDYAYNTDAGAAATLFPTGNLDFPVEVACDGEGTRERYWIPQESIIGINGLYGAVFVDGRVAIAVGNESILRSETGGRTWSTVEFPDSAETVLWDVARSSDSGTLVAVGTGGRIVRSTDNGLTWTQAPDATSRSLEAVDYAGDGRWYAVGEDRIMMSVDDGANWTSTPTDPGTVGARVGVAFRDAMTGIVIDRGTSESGSGRTWMTADGGETWENVIVATGVQDITYAGNDTWHITQSIGSNRRVLRSQDNAASGSWEIIEIGPAGSERPVDIIFVTPDRGFIADNAGVLRTDDGGDTWKLEAFPESSMRAMAAINENRAIGVGTSGRIFLTTSGGGFPVSSVAIEEGDPSGIPASVTLGQNYPNPFRGATNIAYELDRAQQVRLEVFDMLGRRVTTLVDRHMPAGAHTATFEAHGVASGVYLYRLSTEKASELRRMVLVR